MISFFRSNEVPHQSGSSHFIFIIRNLPRISPSSIRLIFKPKNFLLVLLSTTDQQQAREKHFSVQHLINFIKRLSHIIGIIDRNMKEKPLTSLPFESCFVEDNAITINIFIFSSYSSVQSILLKSCIRNWVDEARVREQQKSFACNKSIMKCRLHFHTIPSKIRQFHA